LLLTQNLDHYHSLKQQKWQISLNLKQRHQQGQPPVKSLQDLPKNEKTADPYLEEGLAITRDWLRLAHPV
jgi:hypothetical protein